jgi:hypothetical protein
MKVTTRTFSLLAALIVASAGDMHAQQSAWPDNWIFFPKGKGENVYRLDEDAASGSRVLAILTNKDVGTGSLLVNSDMPLTEHTTLEWRWNVRSIPSAVAENTEQTHHYLAIAVMCDNDQVLSYMWSATLGRHCVSMPATALERPRNAPGDAQRRSAARTMAERTVEPVGGLCPLETGRTAQGHRAGVVHCRFQSARGAWCGEFQ